MSAGFEQIKTIVIVMMENRSFDNLLGYLAMAEHPEKVDGISNDPCWLDRVSSTYAGSRFAPFALTDPYDAIDADPPHERENIALQMGKFADGNFAMDGFVQNYATAKGSPVIAATSKPPVMGYFTAEQAPAAGFLATHFAVCDRWHASLPAGTQPNRLLAMSGFSTIDVNHFPLPHQELVYDWLDRHEISWRVYHAGLPFFAMMIDRLPEILDGDRFRPFETLSGDVLDEALPQVVFVEPVYTDAPHVGPSSDDHAPSGIKGGQEFLLEVYRSLTSLQDTWANMVMVVTYDEHGGFFDHISPPALRTDPPPGASYKAFETLGVRVPAFVVSPFVKPGSVFSGLLDHTSILKLIAQVFGGGSGYSDAVDKRPVGSVAEVLNDLGAVRTAPVIPSLKPYLDKQAALAGRFPGKAPETPLQQGFNQALDQIRAHPRAREKFGDLLDHDFPS
jgi:phospholipase C